jgi:hypothetical protein
MHAPTGLVAAEVASIHAFGGNAAHWFKLRQSL